MMRSIDDGRSCMTVSVPSLSPLPRLMSMPVDKEIADILSLDIKSWHIFNLGKRSGKSAWSNASHTWDG